MKSTILQKLGLYFVASCGSQSATAWMLVLSLLSILLAVVVYRKKNARIEKKRIPGLKLNAIVTAISIFRNVVRNKSVSQGLMFFQVLCGLTHIFREEGMWFYWLGTKPVLVISKAEAVERILNSNHIIEKGFIYDVLKKWLKEGLLISKSEKWRYRRKLLTPAFHFRTLNEFIPVFNKQPKVLANKLQLETESKEFVDIAPLASLCTSDIICETAMGKQLNAQFNSTSPYIQALHEACKAVMQRVLQPWLLYDFIYYRTEKGKSFKRNLEVMDNFTRQVVFERKMETISQMECKEHCSNVYDSLDEEIGRKAKKRLALLDLLLEVHFKNSNFTLEDIAEEIDNFIFAGHDTASSGISWALYLLGLHPEIQRKVQEELDDVLGDDADKIVTVDDIKDLKYLECVIKEVHRLFPPTPYIARQLLEDTDINGYIIPKGTNCGIFIYMLHRDPDAFPNPEVFDPDRFTSSNSKKRRPFTYIPFSAGTRNCIGQRFASIEIIIVLATILRRFKLRSQLPLDKLLIVNELVLRSENGLPIKFTPRKIFRGRTEK